MNYSRKEQAPRRVFHGGIFPHHTEEYRDRSKWSLRTFDLTRFVVLTENLTASETDETLTRVRLAQTTHVYMCHAISFMSYDVSDLERFPISHECFFFILSTNFRFLTFLVGEIFL